MQTDPSYLSALSFIVQFSDTFRSEVKVLAGRTVKILDLDELRIVII